MTKQKKLIQDEENEFEDINGTGKETEETSDSSLGEFDPDPSTDYRSLQSVVTYDDEEYLHNNKLNGKIDEIIQKSRWTVINPSKKIPKAYESIHMKYKEQIVQEMDAKYGILGKKGIKKIF